MADSNGLRWLKTVGAPEPGDSRDGAMHQSFGRDVPKFFDLEPLGGDEDGPAAHYVIVSDEPELDGKGRPVWIYTYRP